MENEETSRSQSTEINIGYLYHDSDKQFGIKISSGKFLINSDTESKREYDDLTDSSNNYTIDGELSEQGIFLEGFQIEAGFMYSLSSFIDIAVEAGYMMPVGYERKSLTVKNKSFGEEETNFEKSSYRY